MKTLTLVVAAGLLAGVALACAATERTITQKGRKFSDLDVAVRTGDTLLFVNDDTVAHNIYSTSPNNTFNLGAQAPGTSTPVTFDRAGNVDVICAIHPLMKLKVTVAD